MRIRRLTTSNTDMLRMARPAIYALKGGILYSRCSLTDKELVRRSATILLTASGRPVDVVFGRQHKRYVAVAVKPLVRHRLFARNVGLVSLLVAPDHAHYPAFRNITDGEMPLPREAFARFDRRIEAAYHGALNARDAQRLFDDIIATTVAFMPPAKPLDIRLHKVMKLLKYAPNQPLEEIADAVGISYHRMSHLFADSIGLPLRSYRLWQKEANVAPLLESGYTLRRAAADAGFRDATHLCRVFRQAYGAPPSYIYNNPETYYVSIDKRTDGFSRTGTARRKDR